MQEKLQNKRRPLDSGGASPRFCTRRKKSARHTAEPDFAGSPGRVRSGARLPLSVVEERRKGHKIKYTKKGVKILAEIEKNFSKNP